MIVRSIDYAGEPRPVTVKRVIVVNVDDLPLRDEVAIHRIKVLAGPRWTPSPPADSGVSELTVWNHGFVKISCEDFPKPAMNLKWATDTLDRLIAEANVCWVSIPVGATLIPQHRNRRTSLKMYLSICDMCTQRQRKRGAVSIGEVVSSVVLLYWISLKIGYLSVMSRWKYFVQI